MAKRYSRSWMLYRLEHVLGATKDGIKDEVTTAEVRSALKVSDPVLRRWLRDPFFIAGAVAHREGSQWLWDREKTILWVIAALKLSPDDEKPLTKAKNPPKRLVKPVSLDITPEQARKSFRMPLDYNPRSNETRSDDSED